MLSDIMLCSRAYLLIDLHTVICKQHNFQRHIKIVIVADHITIRRSIQGPPEPPTREDTPSIR
jgi:hypothetical protein